MNDYFLGLTHAAVGLGIVGVVIVSVYMWMKGDSE